MGARLQNDSSSPCRSYRKHQMVIVAAKQVTKFISFPGVHCEWLLSVSNKETTVDSYLSQIAIGPQSWINNGSQTSSCQHTPLKAWPTKLTIKWWILSQPMSLCSADPLREAAESWKGSPQRHPVQSPSHDSRQEVSPEDIQVCGSAVLFVFLKNYVLASDWGSFLWMWCWFTENYIKYF